MIWLLDKTGLINIFTTCFNLRLTAHKYGVHDRHGAIWGHRVTPLFMTCFHFSMAVGCLVSTFDHFNFTIYSTYFLYIGCNEGDIGSLEDEDQLCYFILFFFGQKSLKRNSENVPWQPMVRMIKSTNLYQGYICLLSLE